MTQVINRAIALFETGKPSEYSANGCTIVTRSNKANDRNHAALADGSAVPEDHLPRYFAKSGYADADPTSVKKSGGGRGNWYDLGNHPA